MGTKTLMTVEEFSQMITADTENYELVEGDLVPLSSGTPRHNLIRDLIGHLLWAFFKANPIGKALAENNCLVASDTVRCPDLAVFLSPRLQLIDLDIIPAPFAPDIAIEVISPSERAIDVRRKVLDYLRGGSAEVWLLDHSNGEVLVHKGGSIKVLQGSDVLESTLLPGFSVLVADLWQNL